MFGAPGAPAAEVADAVVASCSIPWVFEPVAIGGREYVDGGVWSVTNLDAAPAAATRDVLCLGRRRRGLARCAARSASRPSSRRSSCAAGARTCDTTDPDRGQRGGDRRGPHGFAPAAEVLAAGHRQGRALAAG